MTSYVERGEYCTSPIAQAGSISDEEVEDDVSMRSRPGRAWITLDGMEIFSTVEGGLTRQEFFEAVKGFPNMPVEEVLAAASSSDKFERSYFFKILAVADRRVGKRRLLKMAQAESNIREGVTDSSDSALIRKAMNTETLRILMAQRLGK
jgi:hypothetical protein